MVANLIGKERTCAREILRAHGMTPMRQILTPELFGQAYPCHPTPKTILSPEVVFWLMAHVALGAGSMAGSMAHFWSSLRALLPWLPAVAVQEEAFCSARRRLSLRFFLQLFFLVVRGYRQAGLERRWKGLRLLGTDGMENDLPRHPHLRRLFPPAANQYGSRGAPQARLVGLVGLHDGICYDFRWTNLRVSEQASVRRLLPQLGPHDLLLADRNFPDKATFAGILAQEADFLFHLPQNRFRQLARTPTASGRRDEWLCRIPLPPELQKQYPQLPLEITVRILEYQRPGFRTSWLITALLDTQSFTYAELVELYHQRWRQETFHREWKYSLDLSNLRSHRGTGLLKEVLVQLTLNNVIRWIMRQAAGPTLLPVQLKFLQAKRLILAAIPAMTVAPTCCLPGLYRQLLAEIARQRIWLRPGRSYPRKWDARGRPKGHGKVTAPAKLPLLKENSYAPI